MLGADPICPHALELGDRGAKRELPRPQHAIHQFPLPVADDRPRQRNDLGWRHAVVVPDGAGALRTP